MHGRSASRSEARIDIDQDHNVGLEPPKAPIVVCNTLPARSPGESVSAIPPSSVAPFRLELSCEWFRLGPESRQRNRRTNGRGTGTTQKRDSRTPGERET